MGSRKQISVNLRDLQRVLHTEEDDLPNTTTDSKNKFGAAKKFEYKLSSNRWENEDYDDDFDVPLVAKNKEAEPDFSKLRNPVPKPAVDTKSPPAPSPQNETTANQNWRATDFSPTEETDDSWRSLRVKEESKGASQDFKSLNRRKQSKDTEFARESKPEEQRKLYVPRFRREASPSPPNDRFSCLGESRGGSIRESEVPSRADVERRPSKSPPREERTRDDWGLDEKSRDERPRNEEFRKPVVSESQTGAEDKKEAPKKGLFVPSYKRNQKKEDTVEDMFIKAAGYASVSEYEKSKKEASENEKSKEVQDNQALMFKRNEVVKHNKLFKCSQESVELIEEYVLEALKEGEGEEFPDIVEEESLVPSVLTCVIVAKKCETCQTLEEVQGKFKRVKRWLKHTTKSHDARKLLTELSKATNHWGYPSLSESVYLVEALFDSLYSLGIVEKGEFMKWFESDVEDIPDRVTLLLQLMNWKKWLSGEEMEEAAAEESESFSDSEDDSSLDIEANVPKPIRLTKGVKFK